MEDDQQFCLRWNNHQSTLIQNFDTLLESGTLVDCTLAAEGKYLKAHKVVLSACSPYFEGLLSEHYDKHPVFILKDVKFKELKAMMDYMYRGEVNISQDQLAALLKAAESLQIKGLSESKTSGSSKTDSRQQKVVPQTSQPDIPISSSGLTIEKNKVPRQGVSQGPLGDLPEDSASPQIPKGLSSREGSQSPTSRKRKRFRRKSIGDDNSVENHEASNSSDMPQQMGVPALGIAPVADEKSHADPTDSIGRSALMTQLTKPADEMLQLPLEKPEPSDNLIEPKSEYLEDPEESVEDLTLDDDMNDLNEMEQDNNRAGPSHDPSQHPGTVNPNREEMPSENEVLPKKQLHFLQSYQGPASKTRRRCKQCYKRISKIKGREYALKRAKKVTTYCDRCKGQPTLCLTCFRKLHEERK
ncbi:longitudinals lacking protein, isoforms H/M/V-like isoform X41 [Bombus pyrosoma]|uniref:longitudinals lacking protein, isoforms H/M/V-like isoform X41 n=1 Tax=Bombus pyrosoma TaxID=396416 RepID=UPI001CB89D26|nr:longitudinals lacking protein, isoforms H/M/V-like isoform X41 [Bombus pyrosoma]